MIAAQQRRLPPPSPRGSLSFRREGMGAPLTCVAAWEPGQAHRAPGSQCTSSLAALSWSFGVSSVGPRVVELKTLAGG